MSNDVLDAIAAVRAALDQAEMDLGAMLGLDRQVPLGVHFLVSPDVGQRLTRDGVIPERVHISWALPEKSIYAVDPAVFSGAKLR